MRLPCVRWPVAAALQFALATVTHAQWIEDIDWERQGQDAVAQIRFIAPVQLQRTVSSKAGDLVQVFYNVTAANEVLPSLNGERRVSKDNGLPEIIFSDESVSRDNPLRRKLLIQFEQPVTFKVRSGPTRDSLEIVLGGMGAALVDMPDATPPPSNSQYYVVLASSPQPGLELPASVPSEFQAQNVFTASRVINGQIRYEIALGYFSSAEEAAAAQKVLLRRFPSAEVLQQDVPSLPPPPPVPQRAPAPESASASPASQPPSAAAAATPDPAPEGAPAPAPAPATLPAPAASADTESQAAQWMAKADAANDRGDYADAIAALDALLRLPPNQQSRKAQEQIGVTRLKEGDRQRARAEFETFLSLYPQGADSDRVRQYLANLPAKEVAVAKREAAKPAAVISGSLSTFYYGGQSQTRSQDFADSPLSGLPVLQSENSLSSVDQKQVQTNLDINRRYRDAEVDQRLVLRNTYTSDMMPNRPDKNRLSALYVDHRWLTKGTSIKVGRQSPTGGGVLYRFDGVQAGYSFAPKFKVNAVAGVPTDTLLDTQRNFYGAWIDADALTAHSSGSLYLNQQNIDGEVDRRALGVEWRYFNEGVALSGQFDYDEVLKGINIIAAQGTWQMADSSQINVMLDRRATPVRSLGNVLFFQDPSLATPARTISSLLANPGNSLELLRTQVNGVTAFQNQAMAGFTTPLSEHWQTGANLNYTNVDEIKPVAVILPQGQPSTGDLWSLSLQLIGLNLYSTLDTHIFSATFLTGPTYRGTLYSYNNLTGLGERLRLEPSLRFYTQNTTAGEKTNRWSPGLRVSYRIGTRLSIESELSVEISDVQGPSRIESSERMFYYVGGRYDF